MTEYDLTIRGDGSATMVSVTDITAADADGFADEAVDVLREHFDGRDGVQVIG